MEPGADRVRTVFNAPALAALRRAAKPAHQDQQQQLQQRVDAVWEQPKEKASSPQQQQQPTGQASARQQQLHQPQRPRGAASDDVATPFDPDVARVLARLTSAAYCADYAAVGAWGCPRCAAVPGFAPVVAHRDADWDLSGYAGYLPWLNAKVVVFRGTDSSSWYNWAENMRAWRTDANYPVPGAPAALRIHSGFHVMWNGSSMASTFMDAYKKLLQAHPTGPTFVVGHSMGGALAHLCALDLRVAFDPPDLRVVTFGSPRVGNSVFADFFESHVAQSWRFTHGRDIVPSVPPTVMGFRHVSREVWLVDVDTPSGGGGGGGGDEDVDQRIIVCDESGEDPTCHSSVCHLGLCTSVADHYAYLGEHMYQGDGC